ncbi:hypothetical protein GC163_04735 [bacterium]|nr:hypothetical protein [bacterium]
MNIRQALARNLALGLICLGMALLAGLLALLLHAGGDVTGTSAVLGVFWVMGTAAVVSFLAQIVLLSWHVLALAEMADTKSVRPETDA